MVGMLVTLVVPANAHAIESAKIDTPVIASIGNGWVVAVWSQPVGQAIADEYSLEVCHGADCGTARFMSRMPYTANSSSGRTAITASFLVPADDASFLHIRELPLTATISEGSSPSDFTRSDPSAPFYLNMPEHSPIDTTLQFMQPVLRSLKLNGLSMGVCFNRTSDAFRRIDESGIGLRFPGYSMMYEVSKAGTVIQSGKSKILNQGIQGNWYNGRYCEDGPDGDEPWQIFDPILGCCKNGGAIAGPVLDAGTTYTITYSLVADLLPAVSGSLDFTTPGGCPSTPPGPPKHLVPSYWSALLDSSGRFLAMFQGFNPRQSAYMSKAQSVSLYHSAYKTFPYDSSYLYIPEIDDFAIDMSSLSTSGKYMIKDATIFKDCSPEQVQIVASTEDFSGIPNDSGCQIVEGNIIPMRVGRCILRVQVTRTGSVTASGVRAMGFTFTRNLAVNFSSLSTPVPGVSKTMTVRRSKPASAKSIAIFAKIPVLSKSKVSLKVLSGYTKFCKVSSTTLRGLKNGTCKIKVTVTPIKGKATSKTVTLTVTN